MTDSPNGYAEQVRHSIEAFNAGDTAGYVSHYADDAVLVGPFFPEPLVGRESIEVTTVAMSNAFPDMRWSIVSLLQQANTVACELHIEGTHSGPLITPDGQLPATGRTVSFGVFEILEFNEDGLVAEHREYMDPAAVLAQLGLATG